MRKYLSLSKRLAVMGPPALLTGEDENAYHELLDGVSAAVKPIDIVDRILVQDYHDYAWEVARLRRQRAELLNSTMHLGLERLLLSLLHSGADGDFVPSASRHPYSGMEACDWAERWNAGDPVAISKVDTLLKAAGLTMDAVEAQTMVINLDKFERIDRMIFMASQRRDKLLRDIAWRHASLADRPRRATDDVEEADYKIATPKANQSESKT
jgi:hypothetical protein